MGQRNKAVEVLEYLISIKDKVDRETYEEAVFVSQGIIEDIESDAQSEEQQLIMELPTAMFQFVLTVLL